MTSIHTLIEERDRFYADLRFNKNRFIDFLGAMAKHYRHPIPAQVGLFFHGRRMRPLRHGKRCAQRCVTTHAAFRSLRERLERRNCTISTI